MLRNNCHNRIFKLLNSLSLILIIASTTSCASNAQSSNPTISKPQLEASDPNPSAPIVYADRRMKEAGISAPFIQMLHKLYLSEQKEWQPSAERIIELNILGFLYHGDYFSHDSKQAHVSIKRYIRNHKSSFTSAEKNYQVSAKSIASLLWVETKLGKNTGTFPLPWVFYSLLMGSHQNLCGTVFNTLPKKLESSPLKQSITLEVAQTKVLDRCQSKSTWALGELKTLDQMYSTSNLNPFKVKASFAGAFGIPQFIPSSYLKFATSTYRNKPNLFIDSDAILSVGRFLKSYGWEKESSEAQTNALFAYNRSKDYGLVIKQIAKAL